MAELVDRHLHPLPAGRGLVRGLRAQLSDSFSRNAYALMVNTGMNGVLGLAFWVVAARHYSAADVGRGSALISAFTLLSAVVGINVTGTLTRFLPRTGRHTTRFVVHTYWISSAVVVALTLGFLLLVPLWGPSFATLREPLPAVWFLLVVVLAGIFTVQDGVLVGLRRSVWVPVENTVFGVAKLVLLVALAAVTPADGVYLSFVVAMAVVTLPLNGLIFGRLLRRRLPGTAGSSGPPTRTEIRHFFAGDYVGAVFAFSAAYVVPVIVAGVVLPETFASYYIVWMVWGSLQLVSINMAQSLTVEGVFDAAMLATYTRSALRRSGVILGVACAALGLGAPLLLGVLGPRYAEAVPLLRLLALTAFPRAILEVWLGVLRAQGRARSLARVQVASGIAVVGAVVVGLFLDDGHLGLGLAPITSVGVLVLLSQTLVTAAVLPEFVRFLRSSPRRPGSGRRLVDLTVVPTGPAPYRLLERGARPPSPRPRAREVALTAPSAPAAPSAPSAVVRARDAVLDVVAGLVARCRTVPRVPVLAAVTVVALLLFWLPLVGADLGPMSGLGLVSVLPVATLVGLAVLGLAFVGALALRRPRRWLLAAQLLVTTVCLHGVTMVTEALPRFAITYVHLGMIDHIVRTGIAPPVYDARFSWPGFFALVGSVSQGADLRTVLPLIAAVPLVSNLLYVLALALVLRAVRASWQAKWFVLWLFVAGNWVGQDYFSPQGATYFLYLAFLGVLLTWFRPSSPVRLAGGRLVVRTRRVLRLPVPTVSGELPPPEVPFRTRTTMLAVVLGLFVVTAATHQLTPFVMLGVAAGLVLVDRCVVRGLPAILALVLVAWISYMTAPYWTGHLHELVAGVGDLGGTFSSGVQERAAGDPDHQVVVLTRIALCLGLFGLAAVGLWRRARRAVDDRVLLVLLVVPVLAAGLQSYGGEIVLRVYLFALPALCVLVALAVFPDARSRAASPFRLVAAGLCTLLLLGGFLLARYGNEAYEQMRPQEYAAAEFVYDQPGPATVLFPTETRAAASTPFLPISYRDIERVRVAPVTVAPDPADIAPVIARMREQATTPYLLVSRGQLEFLAISSGYPPGWGERFEATLDRAPELAVVRAEPDARLYVLRDRPAVAAAPVEALPPGFVGATPWTPVGVAFLGLLLVTLVGREVWQLRHARERWADLWPLRLLWAPLVLAFLGVLIERTIVLTS